MPYGFFEKDEDQWFNYDRHQWFPKTLYLSMFTERDRSYLFTAKSKILLTSIDDTENFIFTVLNHNYTFDVNDLENIETEIKTNNYTFTVNDLESIGAEIKADNYVFTAKDKFYIFNVLSNNEQVVVSVKDYTMTIK